MNVIKLIGSITRVKRVFWYDSRGYAGVEYADGFCSEVSVTELECLTPDMNTYADLTTELRKRAMVTTPELVR